LPAVPSEETLRQRIDELAQAQEIPGIIKFSNVEMLKKVSYFGTEKMLIENIFHLILMFHRWITQVRIKRVYPGLTKIMTVMHQYCISRNSWLYAQLRIAPWQSTQQQKRLRIHQM